MKYGFSCGRDENYPPMVQLTITNVCDMACNHCPHKDYIRMPDYKPKYMSMELYDKIVREVGHHEDTMLRIFGWGEPLLHPDIIEMVRRAKDNGVSIVNLITNGLKLDNDLSKSLINAGLDLLEVSLDAYTIDSYGAVRGNPKNFNKVVNNIKDYVNLRDELNGKTYVTVSIINQPRVKDEVNEFKDYWMEVVDEVIVRTFHDFIGFAADKDCIKLPERIPCRCLWSRFNVNTDGLISVCFNDWFNKSILNDLSKPGVTIESVWQSDDYKSFRQSHLDGKPKGVCADCNDWIGASWETPYESLADNIKRRRK